jgi:hypothetical protein
MSFAQQRLWFLDQVHPGSALYNIPVAVRLRGRLDVDALRHTLDEIVRRHEALRTTFEVVGGQPVQVINPAAAVGLRVTELGALPEAAREAEVRRHVQAEARRGFDLARGPLLRAGLLRLADEEHVLLLVIHHIVWDGWSLNVFVKEVAALYESFRRGARPALPELTIQYADFAVWQRERLGGGALEKELGYWRRQLGGAPLVLPLPADRPRPAAPSGRGAEEFVALPAALFRGLDELSRRAGVTLFMTLLAAFQTLLYRQTRQEDIVVGTPVAGRSRGETEQLIGFFINTLLLRVRLDGNPTFAELLGRVRETTLAAYAHQDAPFEKVLDEVAPQRGQQGVSLPQVMIGLQTTDPRPLALPGLGLSPLEAENEVARADLYLSLMNTGQSLSATIAYSRDLFDAPTVRRMLRDFEALLCHVTARPEAALDELCGLLSEGDRRQRLSLEKDFREGSLRRLKGVRRRAVDIS